MRIGRAELIEWAAYFELVHEEETAAIEAARKRAEQGGGRR